MMYSKIYWIAASCIFCLTTLLLTSACKAKIEVGLDEGTLGILESAIDELGRQPDRWDETMQNTIKQLENSGEQLAKAVLVDVRSTYNGILGQTTGEFSCRADFTAQRLQQRLQAIGRKIRPNRFSAPKIVPVICSTNPGDSIKLATTVLVFYGYDLLDFNQTQKFNVVLQYADTEDVVLTNAGYVSQTHNYQLVVDLQSPELKNTMRMMNRDRGPQIVLVWGAADVYDDSGKKFTLPVILPEPETSSTPYPYKLVHETKPFGGLFGEWGSQAMCPMDTWVMGVKLRIEHTEGGGDDTALNSIRLVCGTHSNPGYVNEIDSSTGFWGEWEDAGQCSEGYVTGARLRIEPRQGGGDDTGAVDAQFLCSNGKSLNGKTHHPWGEWKAIQTCPVGSAICGLVTKVEPMRGDIDDTALNDAKFFCCTLP